MADSNKRGRRSARLKLFLFLGLACLAVLAGFGIVTRSTKTEERQQQANQVSTQLTVQDGDKVFELTAREVDGAEREEWWQRGTEAYPHYIELQSLTTRKIPIFVLE